MLLSMIICSELQNNLKHLILWSEKWQLKFNTSKCKVFRFGQTDTKLYTMLESHIVSQVKKANRLMGLIRRSYNFLDIVSFKYFY